MQSAGLSVGQACSVRAVLEDWDTWGPQLACC
jgi:hypothetical protein